MKYKLPFLVLLCLVALCYSVYVLSSSVFVRKLEKVEPNIHFSSPVRGIGMKGMSGILNVGDYGSGVAEVWIDLQQDRGSQGQKTLQVLHQVSDACIATMAVPFEIFNVPQSITKQGITNGEARLIARAKDCSYWGNQKQVENPIMVDLLSPRVEILSGAVNAEHGGVGLVLFRVTDLPQNNSPSNFPNTSGSPETQAPEGQISEIQIGQASYPVFLASKFDSSFADKRDLYFGFFAIPFGFDNSKETVKVVAKDAVGNMGQVSVVTHIKSQLRPRVDLKLSKSFLETVVEGLFQVFVSELASMSQSDEAQEFRLGEIQDNPVLKFRSVNEKLREIESKKIANIVSKSEERKFWDKDFIRPIAAKTTSRFAEDRFYSYEGAEVSRSFHDGLDLASTSQAAVFAANSGKVLFTGDLGIYGNAIIIDHGFGLISLYGHLSSYSVIEGQELKKGEQIARTGQTGLAGGDHLHFELRLNNIPVTPIEWWDPKWIHARIATKIEEVSGVKSAS